VVITTVIIDEKHQNPCINKRIKWEKRIWEIPEILYTTVFEVEMRKC